MEFVGGEGYIGFVDFDVFFEIVLGDTEGMSVDFDG